MLAFSTEQRLKGIVALGLFAALALSPTLWLTNRVYPHIPLIPALGQIPAPFDVIAYATMLVLAVAIAFLPKPAHLMGLCVAFGFSLAIVDQSRWQPWFYMYMCMIAAIGWYAHQGDVFEDDKHPALNFCRLLICCTYFWSGLHKWNLEFTDKVFEWMTQPLMTHLPAILHPIILASSSAVPILESVIGIGLLIPRFRKPAVIVGIGMHLFILFCIGPLGHNKNVVVWPWNLVMICLLLTLFGKQASLRPKDILWCGGALSQKLALVLFLATPALSMFNLWDEYLSFSLYAGRKNYPFVYVSNSYADRLPPHLLQHVFLTDTKGKNVFDVSDWSSGELNVPAYPEPRVYKILARQLCQYAKDPSELQLVIRSRVLFKPVHEDAYSCRALIE